MKILIIGLLIILSVFSVNGQRFVKNISYKYSVINDWYIDKSCDKYDNDSIICKTDSVLIYTPIKYFLDENKPVEEDTLSILGYSSVLREINEPKIYNNRFDYSILRFSWFRDTLPIFYRLKIKGDKIQLNYKITNGNFDFPSSKILTEKTIDITLKDYNKLMQILEKGNFWGMDTKFTIATRNVLIESYIDNKYYFINKDMEDIKINPQNRHLMDCFKLLGRLINK
jgi:hypothetical protein